MTTYYCDLAADFVDRSGVDSTTNVLTGPGGFQNKIRGIGSASALAAGDTLLLKGTAPEKRFVKLTCGKDVTGWTIGDVVRDNGGGAVIWQGLLCQTNVGAANTVITVQLDSSYQYSTVNTANGIQNTTHADSTTLSAKACQGILIDTNSGSSGSPITLIGVNASWMEDGTLAILNGGSAATNGISSIAKAQYVVRNLRATATTGAGFSSASVVSMLWLFRKCKADSCGGGGFAGYWYDTTFEECVASANTGFGIVAYRGGSIQFCVATGNSDQAILCWATTTPVIGCVSYGNTAYNYYFQAGGPFINCVSYGGTGVAQFNPTNGAIIVGCRIVGSSGYGLTGTSGFTYPVVRETRNVFYGNATSDLRYITSAVTSYGDGANHISDPADDGMVDSDHGDFNVATGKELRSEAIDLNWDL